METKFTPDPDVNDCYDEETESRRDVADGGLLGAVSGGIVGAFAGGPLGAVIGAVIGGGASAVAVDALEHQRRESELFDSGTSVAELVYDDNIAEFQEAKKIAYAETDRVQSPAYVDATDDVAVDSIRVKAYSLWLARGSRDGFADDDWLLAEQEYLDELAAKSAVDNLTDSEEVEEVVGYSA